MEKSDGLIGKIVYRFARKYIAGNTAASMLKVVGRMNAEGLRTTITFLSNNVYDAAKARYNTKAYMEAARQLSRLGLNSDISIRPSQIGYSFDGSMFRKNIGDILKVSNGKGIRIWLESDSAITSQELVRMYTELKKERHDVGIELPEGSAAHVRRFGVRDHVRIWNGSKGKANAGMDNSWILELAGRGANVTVSGRDHEWLSRIARTSGSRKKNLIFEMPLGYNTGRLVKLFKGSMGQSMYVPYGMDWVPYVTNRIAEGNVRKIASAVLSHHEMVEKDAKKKRSAK